VNLNVNLAGAKAVLYYRDSILSIVNAAGGISAHSFPALSVADTVWVTVSADYHKPYTGYIRVLPAVGITETEKGNSSPYIYPNPARSSLYVGRLSEQCRYTCYSATGALVLQGNIDQRNNRIDIPTLAEGQYYLKLEGKVQYKALPFQVIQ
jgi:gingipain R